MINEMDSDLLCAFLKVKNKIYVDEEKRISPNDYLLFLTVIDKGFVNDLNEKTITLTGLAHYLDKSKPALTKQTKKLVKKGYLRKEKTGIDKRNRYIILTNEAFNLVYDNKTLGIVSLITERLGVNDTKELIRLLNNIDAILRGQSDEENS